MDAAKAFVGEEIWKTLSPKQKHEAIIESQERNRHFEEGETLMIEGPIKQTKYCSCIDPFIH